MKKKLGLIVNPVAGMGGSVGLKGTDGELYREALKLGAQPVTPARTRDVVAHLAHADQIELYTAPGRMGADHIDGSTAVFATTSVVGGELAGETTAEDTRGIAREMMALGVELLIFVGGDGTARDIYDAVGLNLPVVAVPSGVKVFSAVFSYSARAAAELIDAFIEGAETTEEEVLDIDEAAFRQNKLASKLYGSLRVPAVKRFLQGGKEASGSGVSVRESKQQIAAYVVETMEPRTLYLLGPGTTVKSIADAAGVRKTLLGVDAYADGNLVGSDVNEKAILSLADKYPQVKIIVTPIGGNGFIFGRGSKQFTPEVITRAGRKNIAVVATPDKLHHLEALRVDTGDFELDQVLAGYIEVIIGYKEVMKMEVRC
jgi:predicted polyphosphate/ATP-dependent NAD kinase